ncbi:Uncharacterised protein [Cutibacterium granulosum]|uniref:Uncharacterized protein n=1 Tax=Cutibacterium granulosum TaxID=33011 RepID=A0A239X2E0_9ACTN|nr:Uncharacterised protein [Cutibacterium granulosum]
MRLAPKKMMKTIRMTMMIPASLRYVPADRAHGSSVRRLATTRMTAPAISAMSSGLFVRLTAAAAPMAHAHQAHGWVVRVSWLTVTPEFLVRLTGCSGMTVRAGRVMRRDTVQRRPLRTDHLP